MIWLVVFLVGGYYGCCCWLLQFAIVDVVVVVVVGVVDQLYCDDIRCTSAFQKTHRLTCLSVRNNCFWSAV